MCCGILRANAQKDPLKENRELQIAFTEAESKVQEKDAQVIREKENELNQMREIIDCAVNSAVSLGFNIIIGVGCGVGDAHRGVTEACGNSEVLHEIYDQLVMDPSPREGKK
jgi:hypothetical protein